MSFTKNTAKISLAELPVGAKYSYLNDTETYYILKSHDGDEVTATFVNSFNGHGYETRGPLTETGGRPSVPKHIDLTDVAYDTGTLLRRYHESDGTSYIFRAIKDSPAGATFIHGTVTEDGQLADMPYPKGTAVFVDKNTAVPVPPAKDSIIVDLVFTYADPGFHRFMVSALGRADAERIAQLESQLHDAVTAREAVEAKNKRLERDLGAWRRIARTRAERLRSLRRSFDRERQTLIGIGRSRERARIERAIREYS